MTDEISGVCCQSSFILPFRQKCRLEQVELRWHSRRGLSWNVYHLYPSIACRFRRVIQAVPALLAHSVCLWRCYTGMGIVESNPPKEVD